MGLYISAIILLAYSILPLGLMKGMVETAFFHIPFKRSAFLNIMLHLLLLCVCRFLPILGRLMRLSFEYAPAANYLAFFVLALAFIACDSLCTWLGDVKKAPRKKLFAVIVLWWSILLAVIVIPTTYFSFSNAILEVDRKQQTPFVLFGDELLTNGKMTREKYQGNYKGERLIIHTYPYGGIYLHHGNKKITLNIQTFLYHWRPASFFCDEENGLIYMSIEKECFLYDIDANTIRKLYPAHVDKDIPVLRGRKCGLIEEYCQDALRMHCVAKICNYSVKYDFETGKYDQAFQILDDWVNAEKIVTTHGRTWQIMEELSDSPDCPPSIAGNFSS